MSLKSIIRNDIIRAKRFRFPWWALLIIGLVSLFTLFVLDYLGYYNKSLLFLDIFVLFFYIIFLKWDQRGSILFWCTLISIFAIHFGVVSLIDFEIGWYPAVIAIAVMALDLLLILCMLAVVRSISNIEDR